ncbi:hypothetical protein L0Y59_03960, partial [Candidatus Uhrbacteria bacterium]|nr:hypothetical protein [Candidatus Uhrbacteria bacterium]
YALLRDPDGRIFLLTTDAKRHIADMDAFRKFGFNADEVEPVTTADLAAYPEGPKITVETSFPQGVLMKTAASPGVWYVENGTRAPLVDVAFLHLYFSGRRIRTVATADLDAIPTSGPYLLHDGELVKSSPEPTVYVVENGALRPIPSGEIFEAVGWRWTNVITVPEHVLKIHAQGTPFEPNATRLEVAAAPL